MRFRKLLENMDSFTAKMLSHGRRPSGKVGSGHTWTILDMAMSVLGAAIGMVAGYAVGFWLIPYLIDPNHPYVGGSLFTLAQVMAIFGAFGIAAGLSNHDSLAKSLCRSK